MARLSRASLGTASGRSYARAGAPISQSGARPAAGGAYERMGGLDGHYANQQGMNAGVRPGDPSWYTNPFRGLPGIGENRAAAWDMSRATGGGRSRRTGQSTFEPGEASFDAPKSSWRESRSRSSRIAQAREDGSFATKRFAYNQANRGKFSMDGDGNISRTKEKTVASQVPKSELSDEKKPTPDAPAPETPTKPAADAPTNPLTPPAPVVASTPTRRAYNPMARGTIVDEGGDRTGAIARNLNASGKKPVESLEPKWKQRRKPIFGFRLGSTVAARLNK